MNRRDFLKGSLWMGAAAFASDLAAGAKGEYDHYRDWSLSQVEIPSKENGDDVRLHFDMTKPLHGPYLTNPGYGEMTVSFVTREACATAIDYRVKGTEEWTREWLVTYGMLDYTRRNHSFHLKGLKPATEYEYRFAACSSRYMTAYASVTEGREVWSFRTLDPKSDTLKAFVTADIHGSFRLNLDFLYGRTGVADADLYILLGDNVEDSMNQPEFYITTGYLDDICRLWGPSRPTMFVRGNHDSWGYHAADGWATWFPRPDAKGYYTIRRGNALFICFDMPQESNTRGVGPEIALQYCKEEREWLKALKKTDEWKSATWRIGCCHYGTRTGNDGMFARFREIFGDEVNEKGNGLDLMLCGHEHYYVRSDPHTTETVHNTKYDSDRLKAKPPVFKSLSEKWNFTEVCGASSEGSVLEIKGGELMFTSCDWQQANQPPLDRFTLRK